MYIPYVPVCNSLSLSVRINYSWIGRYQLEVRTEAYYCSSLARSVDHCVTSEQRLITGIDQRYVDTQ